MSGPALAQHDSHHAIHRAAFREAEEFTRILRHLFVENEIEKALSVVDMLMEHWRTRTLAHADAEEEGLYRDVQAVRPELAPTIAKLTRDHDVLRRLLAEIEGILATRGWTHGIVERFEAMLLLNSIHSRDEESALFEPTEVTAHGTP